MAHRLYREPGTFLKSLRAITASRTHHHARHSLSTLLQPSTSLLGGTSQDYHHCESTPLGNHHHQIRTFARRGRDEDDDDKDLMDGLDLEEEVDLDDDDDDDDDDEEDTDALFRRLSELRIASDEAAAAERAAAKDWQRQEARRALDDKKGRGWTDPWDMDDILSSGDGFDDLPDWTPQKVSRLSRERVRVFSDRIPTLQQLAHLALPPPPPPHPGHGYGQQYAAQRQQVLMERVAERVRVKASGRVASIQALPTWQEKQDAVDELYESVEVELQGEETILGKHPQFGTWVEQALEAYLVSLQQKGDTSSGEKNEAASGKESDLPTSKQDGDALPIFMDCFKSGDKAAENGVPSILRPLKFYDRSSGQGRMLEEWELAAHDETKRIMLRQSTRTVAQALWKNDVGTAPPARVLVHGRQGVGKTAALAAIVASARKSGHLVLYLPACDQLHKNGYYIEPNDHIDGMYDLPILSQEVCSDFVASHGADLAKFAVPKKTVEKYFTEEQIKRLPTGAKDGMPLTDLLNHAAERVRSAPMCYLAMMDVLMEQDSKAFTIVADEFNVFFQPGHYFHEHYDPDVRKSIPYDQISLFQPVMEAMGLSLNFDRFDETSPLPVPKMMKRGGIIVATSESRAVARKVTDAVIAAGNIQSEVESTRADSPMNRLMTVEVPRLSRLEVDHMLSNYEATGIGKLRLDQGATVMNEQEVEFLRAVSSSVPQKLMNACIAA